MTKILVPILALMLLVVLAAPALAAEGRAIPKEKGELETVILVHYEKPDNPGKGRGGGNGGGGGDGGEEEKVLDYYELLGPKWLTSPVSYTIDTSFSPVDPTAVAQEIIAGFEAWDDATSVELFVAPVITDGVTLDFYDLNNTVVWRVLSGYSKAIAVTVLRYYDNDLSGTMTAGDEFAAFDMAFNLMQKWGIDPDGEGPLTADVKGKWFDVRNIAMHEGGHVVGLDDLYDNAHSEITMYGYASPKETKKISLAIGDTLGTEALYGP